MVEDNFEHLEEDSDRLYKTVENLDNIGRKNNLDLKGLKEGLVIKSDIEKIC